jgi:hypothetical protein
MGLFLFNLKSMLAADYKSAAMSRWQQEYRGQIQREQAVLKVKSKI